jgi:hypothetical protein
MEEGKRGKVLKLPLSEHANLGQFFSQEENKYMSWIYDVQFGNFAKVRKSIFCRVGIPHLTFLPGGDVDDRVLIPFPF